MPVSVAYAPDPLYLQLGEGFADPVRAADFPQTILRFRNQRAAATVGLDSLSDAEWVAHFGRFEPLPDNLDPPLALRYHGHQFRMYNPDLGDGRGFLFAQLREAGTGRLLDLGTKGSGRTPWSRTADGRLTLKGGVREVLATAMLEALGAPTSRTLSLIETGEDLVRGDEPSPTRSSVMVRLSHSHIRFGSFQRHAFEEQPERLRALVDHVIAAYYPELAGDNDPAAALLRTLVQRMGRLTASWIAAGFVHGVLNTDNMSLTGESFDYGPYRFLPHFDPNFTAAYFDQQGLYAFGRQPEAVFWNLQQLGGVLAGISNEDAVIAALNDFGAAYRREVGEAFARRLGVGSRGVEADEALFRASLNVLGEAGPDLRWEPFFFDWFCGREPQGLRATQYVGPAAQAFRGLLATFQAERPERLQHPYFSRAEPEELLYDEIEAIWAPIAERDDWSAFEAKLAAIEVARLAWGLA
ncbi:protein adenylyltransferase SelO [Phenylobacterium immobile]|uniref:protein adenylyltransferase SelO n=1 Tax=Phenylobacterium immobile TaxID=21 RepID=UPI000A84F650|nr:YdiU family protein [Phenylobacterium immobile]